MPDEVLRIEADPAVATVCVGLDVEVGHCDDGRECGVLNVAPPDVLPTGFNGALKRFLKADAQTAPLIGRPRFVPSWKPYWPKVKTFGVTFPEGITFLPPKPEPEAAGLRSIAAPEPRGA